MHDSELRWIWNNYLSHLELDGWEGYLQFHGFDSFDGVDDPTCPTYYLFVHSSIHELIYCPRDDGRWRCNSVDSDDPWNFLFDEVNDLITHTLPLPLPPALGWNRKYISEFIKQYNDFVQLNLTWFTWNKINLLIIPDVESNNKATDKIRILVLCLNRFDHGYRMGLPPEMVYHILSFIRIIYFRNTDELIGSYYQD